MKNLSKEQIAVIAASFIAMLVLAFQVMTIDSSTNDEDIKSKYKSSMDSILLAESLILDFSKENKLAFTLDIFNFKVKARKIVTATTKKDAVVIKTKWINTNDLELFAKNVVVYSFYFNGKARFTINGKTHEIKVGDVIAVGNIIQQEIVVGTNEPTGNTKIGGEYSGKILFIGERSVYVDTNDKDRVVQFRQNSDAKYFARNLMQDPNAEEKEAQSTPTETPGRRNPRPGGR
ncbi:MAG: hypothetical protein KKD38_04505 [Candidatus Delongbacteria bacterium]|nr:hypothetical protein [Candidatus Delongbacteria bacterium]MCG2760638.1 hypothetical protein [Candidatus Delongbacteria bacterium]